MERYTRLFTDGQAYLRTNRLRVSPSGAEITGDPIQRFALYESSGHYPAEILMLLRELDDYRKTGFTPDQLSRILRGVTARKTTAARDAAII